MDDFSKMTNDQLKLYAKENNINISGAKNKTDLIAKITGLESSSLKLEEQVVIGSDTIRIEQKNPESMTISNDNNVVASKKAEESFEKILPKTPQINKDQVALYSDKNLHWFDVGHIKVGYNIVSKEESEKWLTKSGIRVATPDEVATYYGL